MQVLESVTKAGPKAWGLLLFLLGLNILNFMDRTLPHAFIVDITDDLDMSYTTFTLIGGPLFGIVYAVMGLLMGALADRFNRPRLIAAGVLIWSLMTAATGMAKSVFQFALARGGVAVGEASLSPAALSMLSEVFPPSMRGTASSLYYLGISIGAGGSYLVAASVGESLGWRNCFLLLGGIGAIMAVLVAFLPDPRGRAEKSAFPPGAKLSDGAREMLGILGKSAALRWTLLSAILILFSQGASILDQAWLVREAGLEKSEAQGLVGALFTIGSVAGALLGGPMADLFAKRWQSGRLIYAIVVMMLLAPIGLMYRFIDPASTLFSAAILVGAAAFTLFYGALIATVQDLVPAHIRATTIAVTLLAMALLGTALGNVIAGYLADLVAQLGWAAPIRTASLITNAVGLLALPCLALAALTFPRDRARYGSV